MVERMVVVRVTRVRFPPFALIRLEKLKMEIVCGEVLEKFLNLGFRFRAISRDEIREAKNKNTSEVGSTTFALGEKR